MTPEQARQQAASDAAKGLQPANTSNWSAAQREAYNAQYSQK